MTFREMFISFIISIIAGLVTGALTSSKSNASIQDIRITVINSPPPRVSVPQQTRPTPQGNGANGWEIIAGVAALFLFISVFFAKYVNSIVYYGTIVLMFTVGVAISSTVIGVKLNRDSLKNSIWCLIMAAGAGFSFWTFLQTLKIPRYSSYLAAIQSGGMNSVSFSGQYSGYPIYQTLGLIFLLLLVASVLVEAFALISLPITPRIRNNKVLSAYAFVFSGGFIIIQGMFLFIAYISLSGLYIDFIKLLQT